MLLILPIACATTCWGLCPQTPACVNQSGVCCALCVLHYVLCILCCAFCAVHCVLCLVFYVLCIVCYVLCVISCVLCLMCVICLVSCIFYDYIILQYVSHFSLANKCYIFVFCNLQG